MANRAAVLQAAGGHILRYGLVLIILWFGVFKFTVAEAEAIQPLLSNSPLLGWAYSVLDVRQVSIAIGVIEIVIALLIAVRPFNARLSAIGSIGAIVMFATTLSFLVTTPGSFVVVEGLPVPSGVGGFIIKDVLLLGASIWTAGESLASPGARMERTDAAEVARAAM